MIEHIESELYRRQLLKQAIDAAISLHFKSCTGKLKRGAAQEFIFEKLSLQRTSPLCRLVNERMTLAGYAPKIIKGEMLYLNVSFS